MFFIGHGNKHSLLPLILKIPHINTNGVDYLSFYAAASSFDPL